MLYTYLVSLFVILIGFSVYPLISKKYIGGVGYRKFIPIFLGFSAIGTVIVPFIVYRTFSFDLVYLPLLALLGAMYTFAMYLMLYSVEHYNISIINTIVGSQEVLIALFSSIFFFISDLNSVIPSFLIIMAGIIFLLFNASGKARFSKYVVFTLIAVLLWVFMWVLFYTINTSLPLLYYAILQTFAFIFCLPIAFFQNKHKSIIYYMSDKKFKYIVLAGLLNGVATVVFSFAYKFNAILTPFVGQLGIPIVIIASFLLLGERVKKLGLIGITLITVGSFLYIFV
ncbi:EamA family transporter [Candidatus Parvarchaeota archaeon]|nr:EamA family transporter [Candidatus Parvarchaeota archaeon]